MENDEYDGHYRDYGIIFYENSVAIYEPDGQYRRSVNKPEEDTLENAAKAYIDFLYDSKNA
jgi:hypothetical protein